MQTLSKLDDIIEQLENDANEFSNIKLILNEAKLNSEQLKEALTALNGFKEDLTIIKKDSKLAIADASQCKNSLEQETKAIIKTFNSKTNDTIADFSNEISKSNNQLLAIVSDLNKINTSFITKINSIDRSILDAKTAANTIVSTITDLKEEQTQKLSLLKIILIANCGISLLTFILLFLK